MPAFLALLAAVLLVSCPCPAAADAQDAAVSKVFRKTWEKFSDVSAEAVELAARPDRNDRTLLESLTGRESKYARLMRKAQDILSNAEARELFDDVAALQEKNRRLRREIVDLKREWISAPEDSMNPFAKTRKRIDARIREGIPEELAQNTRKMEELEREILTALRGNGLELTAEQLHYFFISAEGDELVRLMHMAANMKTMQGLIEQQLRADGNNIDLAKYYAGVYLVGIDAYAAAHDAAVERIGVYRQRLQPIIAEARRNITEARGLKARADSAEAAALDANIQINERTIAAAALYDDVLRRRAESLRKAGSIVQHKVDLARNTYSTIVNGSSLIALIRKGVGEYGLLVNFDMPELKAIYEPAMINAFTEISEKIKQEG